MYLKNRAITKCNRCGDDMVIKYSSKNRSYFIGCNGYPLCNNTYPTSVGDLINHLLLSREYLSELTGKIISDTRIQRGDWSAIDELITFAKEALEHIGNERKEIIDFHEPHDRKSLMI